MRVTVWVAIFCFIVVFSCQKRQNLNVEEYSDNSTVDIAEPTESIPKPKIYLTDTTGIYQIESFRDSLLTFMENYDLIIDKQFDGECYGSDSLFFDINKNSLLVLKGYSGCLADVVKSISLYSNGHIKFYNATELFDGTVYRIETLYYKNEKPFYGIRTDFPLDSTNEPGSRTSLIPVDEIELMVNIKKQIDDEARETTRRIGMLPYEIRSDGIVSIKDTIKKTVEERLLLIDSMTFNKLVRKGT